MKFRVKPKIFKTAVKVAIVIVIIVIFLSGLALANKNKLTRGLRIANISVGGLSTNEAQIKIERSADEFLKKGIILRYKNGTANEESWTASREELGVKIDIDSTIDSAYKIGHRKNIFLKIGGQVLAFCGYYNLSLNYSINEKQLENFIGEKLSSINKPAVNANLKYDEKTKNFIQIASKAGTIIDRENFKLQLYKKIEKLTKEEISLKLVHDYPKILENETIDAYNKTQEILKNAPYKLIINDPIKIAPNQISLTKERLIPLIEFKSGRDKNNPKNMVLATTLNKKVLEDYLIATSAFINREPIDAQFIVAGDRVANFQLSQDGLKLEIEKNISKIREKIVVQNSKNIELEISIIPPKIATKNIKNLGITSFLAKGVSDFSGSPVSRVHNIKIGAAKFNGTLLKPDEEFSFNTILGEVGPEQGYKSELTIKRDKTIPEYGGGLCQVSTTAFRVAVYAGLPIKERQAHAFPVKYYNPQGFDATIYPPHPDLRFVNDTPGYLLIQTKINGYELTFEFYGTSDGRKVEIEGPYQYDIKEDGSMKAKLIRRIYDKDGNFILESVFNSNYKSPSLYPIERNPLE